MDLKTFYRVSYGLYIVSAKRGERMNGQIVNTVFQVTADPPTIAVCINRQNLTHGFLADGRQFSISILRQDTPMQFIGTFGFKSGRDIDKFDGVGYRAGITGQPVVVENAIGYFELEKIGQLDVGTHTIFVGKVLDAQCLSDEPPLTYAYYHEVKKGYASKAAPTYIDPKRLEKEAQKKEEPTMAKYVCTVCGYIYDPAKGDPGNGVKPGTPFESLPHGWVCPICGADKDQFEKKG